MDPRRPLLPPSRGGSTRDALKGCQVQCSLRLPPDYVEELRQLAEQSRTSAGGVVMLLLDALDEIRQLAAQNRTTEESVISRLLDAQSRLQGQQTSPAA
jgi:hypothetical protein